MTYGTEILAAFQAGAPLSNEQICQATGFPLQRVATYTARMRDQGLIGRATSTRRPVVHQLAGAARVRAEMLAAAPRAIGRDGESIVARALRTQPASVFDLGRFAC